MQVDLIKLSRKLYKSIGIFVVSSACDMDDIIFINEENVGMCRHSGITCNVSLCVAFSKLDTRKILYLILNANVFGIIC